MLDKFRFINYSLLAILTFVGIKMILSHHIDFPEWLSLSVIAIALASGIVMSIIIPAKEKELELKS